MSDSISSSLKTTTSSVASSTAPSDELIQQLRALPAESRENILESMAEKRPGFVNRVRQLLAQEPAAEETKASTPAEIVAQFQATAAQSSQSYQWDALQWVQGAQGLSLMDFLAAPTGQQQAAEDPFAVPGTDETSETDGYQSQSAMSAYMANKFTL